MKEVNTEEVRFETASAVETVRRAQASGTRQALQLRDWLGLNNPVL